MAMKKIYIIIVLCLIPGFVFGQLSTNELPSGFSKSKRFKQIPSKTMRPFSMQQIQIEDQERRRKGKPPRFGKKFMVDYNLSNAGTWKTESNGDRVWHLKIKSPGAKSLNLFFDQYHLAAGAKLFIYNPDMRYRIGALTQSNNKGTRAKPRGLATGLIYDEELVLELIEPVTISERSILSVGYVVHGYRYLSVLGGDMGGYGTSGSCQVNVNCSEGHHWWRQRNSVAAILARGNTLCTGSLMNNTAQNCSPLFLTANHCLNSIVDPWTGPELDDWVFLWHHESPQCGNRRPVAEYFTSGATVVSSSPASDYALLLLHESPLNISGHTMHFNGWDRTTSPGVGGVNIHHPRGDIKKIATYNMQPRPQTVKRLDFGRPEYFWEVDWSPTANGWSVPEPGSSGSPLFNRQKRVIGQLFGSGDELRDCPDRAIEHAAYGKISRSWGNPGSTTPPMSQWLDPLGLNPQFLNGISESSHNITGSKSLGEWTTNFTIHGVPSYATVNWIYSDGVIYVSGQGTNRYRVKAAPGVQQAGYVRAIVNGGCGTGRYTKHFWIGEIPWDNFGTMQEHYIDRCTREYVYEINDYWKQKGAKTSLFDADWYSAGNGEASNAKTETYHWETMVYYNNFKRDDEIILNIYNDNYDMEEWYSTDINCN